ncbi:MAG: hypothetical protein ABI691_02965 [Ginsengibacter sp.]
MQTKFISGIMLKSAMVIAIFSVLSGCQKDLPAQQDPESVISGANPSSSASEPYPYNLNVILHSNTGQENSRGEIKFRQDKNVDRIITLATRVIGLLPNHSYQLQRAVDPISGTGCLSTSWLTLGLGLQPQTIDTDGQGNGYAQLWRDVSSVPHGTAFYIHFQIVDATTLATVLTSDCYQYAVR